MTSCTSCARRDASYPKPAWTPHAPRPSWETARCRTGRAATEARGSGVVAVEIGYTRVSTRGQKAESQIARLEAAAAR